MQLSGYNRTTGQTGQDIGRTSLVRSPSLSRSHPRTWSGGVCSREPVEIEREGVSRGLRELGGVSGCLSVFDRLEGHGLQFPRGGWPWWLAAYPARVCAVDIEQGLCGAVRAWTGSV